MAGGTRLCSPARAMSTALDGTSAVSSVSRAGLETCIFLVAAAAGLRQHAPAPSAGRDSVAVSAALPAPVDVPWAVAKVAGGSAHSVALCTDGSVFVWGWGWLVGEEVGSGNPAHPHATLTAPYHDIYPPPHTHTHRQVWAARAG